MKPEAPRSPSHWRERLHEIIFEADTPAGRAFDIVLLLAIVASVAVVMLDSVESFRTAYGPLLLALEWGFTLLFTLEYGLRLLAVRRPATYATSFFGMVDLLAILPTYLSLLLPGGRYLMVIRILRLVRVFRVLKLVHYVGEARVISQALLASRRKILVFLTFVLSMVLVVGALMYVIEGPRSGFTSIPISMYWAIVTITTVGYGDIAPETPAGQMLASFLMILGYGVLAVPTGIVSAEMVNVSHAGISTQSCPSCAAEGHEADAHFCRRCGTPLNPPQVP